MLIQTYACQNYLNHRLIQLKKNYNKQIQNQTQSCRRKRNRILNKAKQIGLIEKIRYYQQGLIQTYACQIYLNHRPKSKKKEIEEGLRIWVVI